MENILSVFIDESGDIGFDYGASKYYVVSLVFHNQNIDISNQINRFRNDPVFHVGPLIRREDEFKNISFMERKKCVNKVLILYSILPIIHKEFTYKKKEFNEDRTKVLSKLAKDIYSFLIQHYDYFSSFDLIKVYYDKGQQIVYKALAQAFGISGYPVEFKKDVKQVDYRLAQIADFVTSIRLMELKLNDGTLSKSEEIFFKNKSVFKKTYLRSIIKKEFK